MQRRLPEDVTRRVRAAHDEFMSELESLDYAENTKKTYDKTIDVFIRWLEGGWAPEGPR